MEERGGGQVAAVGGVLGQLREDHHQLVQQALAGGGAALDQVPPGAGQLAQGLDSLRGQHAGPAVARQQAPGQGQGVQPVGLGPQPQPGGPGRRLAGVEHHHAVARPGEGVVERLPQAARRLQPDEHLGRRAPAGQLGAQPGVPRRRGLDLERLLAHGARRGLQRGHHVAALGHVDPDDAADRRVQHGASPPLLHRPPGRPAVRCVAWQRPGLPGAVTLSIGARPAPAGRGRRSCSAIDRARAGGRRGRLLTSVTSSVPKGGDEARRLPATGRGPSGPLRPLAIYKGARRTGRAVAFVDETGHSFRARLGTTWAPTGRPPVLKRLRPAGGLQRRRPGRPPRRPGAGVRPPRPRPHPRRARPRRAAPLPPADRPPLVVVWDRLNAHRAKVVQAFVAAHPADYRLRVAAALRPGLEPREAVQRRGEAGPAQRRPRLRRRDAPRGPPRLPPARPPTSAAAQLLPSCGPER